MKNFIILFLVAFLTQGCNFFLLNKEQRQRQRAERKLERLVEKYPDLLRNDTIRDTIDVIVPEIKIDTIIQTNDDFSGLDTIFAQYNGKIDSILLSRLKGGVKNYYITRPIIKDTIYFKEYDVTVKIFQEDDGQLRVIFDKPKDTIKVNHEIVVPSIQIPNKEWYEYLFEILNKFGILIIFVLLILFLLSKIYGNFKK